MERFCISWSDTQQKPLERLEVLLVSSLFFYIGFYFFIVIRYWWCHTAFIYPFRIIVFTEIQIFAWSSMVSFSLNLILVFDGTYLLAHDASEYAYVRHIPVSFILRLYLNTVEFLPNALHAKITQLLLFVISINCRKYSYVQFLYSVCYMLCIPREQGNVSVIVVLPILF